MCEITITSLRKNVEQIVQNLKTLKEEHANSECSESEDRGEVMANYMLSYRHLEDAKMRLGKVLQAIEGGVSIYDKEEK